MNQPGDPPGTRHAASDRFAALFSHVPLGIALTDAEGTIAEANPALGSLLGMDAQTLRGRDFAELTSTPHDAAMMRALLAAQTPNADDRQQFETSLEHADDGPVRTKITLSYLPSDEPWKQYPVVMVEDINDLHLLHETLRRQNVHDPLTGLPNIGSFRNQLEAAVADPSGGQVALIFLDIDGFRVINDGLGADAGDRMLRTVASKLRSVFDSAETVVARLTGDGFGVLMRGELTTHSVITRVEAALAALGEPIYVADTGVGLSASAGIVLRAAGTLSATEMERAAEITLHRAKESGRAKWMLFEPELTSLDRERYRLGASIAGALETGQFELLYQPTVKLDGSNEFPVVNVSLQWNRPESAPLSPEEFLPMADATGMTMPLGRWLLSESLAAYSRWRQATEGKLPDLCVRLPVRLAIDDDLVGLVRGELERHNLPSGTLRLCADSSTVLDPRGEVLDSLAVLGELGVKLVLAVSGAADLELIHRHKLPVGFVVMTGRIVDALLDEDSNPATVRHLEHLIQSARELGVRIGAEGVRTEKQARQLAELGVIAARGEFYREALSADDIQALLAKTSPAATT